MSYEQGFRSASPLPKILHPYGVCRSSAISFPLYYSHFRNVLCKNVFFIAIHVILITDLEDTTYHLAIIATPSDTTIRVSLHIYTCSTLHIYA